MSPCYPPYPHSHIPPTLIDNRRLLRQHEIAVERRCDAHCGGGKRSQGLFFAEKSVAVGFCQKSVHVRECPKVGFNLPNSGGYFFPVSAANIFLPKKRHEAGFWPHRLAVDWALRINPVLQLTIFYFQFVSNFSQFFFVFSYFFSIFLRTLPLHGVGARDSLRAGTCWMHLAQGLNIAPLPWTRVGGLLRAVKRVRSGPNGALTTPLQPPHPQLHAATAHKTLWRHPTLFNPTRAGPNPPPNLTICLWSDNLPPNANPRA